MKENMVTLDCANKKEAAAERHTMKEEQLQLANEWWLKLRPLIKKFVRETFLDGFEKDDLLQECYIKLIQAMEKYDPHMGVPFESFYKIQLYGWRSNQNKKKRVNFIGEYESEGILIIDEQANVEEMVINKERLERVMQAMNKLSQMEKKMIMAYYIQNKSMVDIAKEEKINYRTALSRKGEAIRKIKMIMKF